MPPLNAASAPTTAGKPDARTVALIAELLRCPDCEIGLADDLLCPTCQRSFLPDDDGIVSALPRAMSVVDHTADELQTLISEAGPGAHGENVVMFERAFHDQQAAYYDQVFADPLPLGMYYRSLVRNQIYDYVRHHPFVVDLCCGTGKSSLPLLERGLRVVGVDVSRRMLQLYRNKCRNENLILLHADATCPPLRAHSCGAIVTLGGLHHILDQTGCVNRCSEALAKDGVLIFHEPLKTGQASPLASILENLYALSDPTRVWGAVRRRLGFRASPARTSIVDEQHPDFTPYEKPFQSAEELLRLMPATLRTIEVRSQGSLTFREFPPALQSRAGFAPAACIVWLDQRISRAAKGKWTGDAIFAVFSKTATSESANPSRRVV